MKMTMMEFTKDNDLLIVPDVHGRSFWREPVVQGDYSHVVFLGDYIDPYPHEYIDTHEALEVFREIVAFASDHPEKVTLLLGNHDMHYVSPLYSSIAKSSRYCYDMLAPMCEIYESHKKLFSLAYAASYESVPCLFTHAGVSMIWMDEHRDLMGEQASDDAAGIADIINSLGDSDKGLLALGDVGYVRGGWAAAGSPMWADYYEVAVTAPESGPSALPYQIFGHTQTGTSKPIINRYLACLDCHRTFFLNEVLTKAGILE